MFKIVKAFQRLELLAPLTAGSRIIFLVLALFPLLAPYELIFYLGHSAQV